MEILKFQTNPFIIVMTLLVLICSSIAAADIAGSKDHPLLTRYPNSRIAEYSKNYDAENFVFETDPEGMEKKTELEGDITRIQYFHESADNQPSPLQLIRNYQNAIKAIGGEILFERKPVEGDGGETTLRVVTNNKEYFIRVLPEIFSAPTQSYKLIILERAAMEQLVGANKMLDQLQDKGFITLYIEFDTGMYDIKPEAQPIIADVVKVLNKASEIKISIEGHTDDVGDDAANKTLSENRARSVMQALVGAGIAAERLSSKGFGEEKPVAENTSAEGRAKNRRVELVKQN